MLRAVYADSHADRPCAELQFNPDSYCMSNDTSAVKPKVAPLSSLIFASRWLQLPLYLGLILAQCVYVFLFMTELYHLIAEARILTAEGIMLLVLGLIDVVMISNLLVMVIVGGYETFVSRLNLQSHPDQPEWLSHVNASVLKVKLAMAIIGISSIHLLKTFIEVGTLGGMPLCGTEASQLAAAAMAESGSHARSCSMVTATGVMWQTIIHTIFILSAIGIAWTDRLMTHATKPAKEAH
jgi:uncharacterized protein (TIGR00645 family)